MLELAFELGFELELDEAEAKVACKLPLSSMRSTLGPPLGLAEVARRIFSPSTRDTVRD